jgi:hypothetical protein
MSLSSSDILRWWIRISVPMDYVLMTQPRNVADVLMFCSTIDRPSDRSLEIVATRP